MSGCFSRLMWFGVSVCVYVCDCSIFQLNVQFLIFIGNASADDNSRAHQFWCKTSHWNACHYIISRCKSIGMVCVSLGASKNTGCHRYHHLVWVDTHIQSKWNQIWFSRIRGKHEMFSKSNTRRHTHTIATRYYAQRIFADNNVPYFRWKSIDFRHYFPNQSLLCQWILLSSYSLSLSSLSLRLSFAESLLEHKAKIWRVNESLNMANVRPTILPSLMMFHDSNADAFFVTHTCSSFISTTKEKKKNQTAMMMMMTTNKNHNFRIRVRTEWNRNGVRLQLVFVTCTPRNRNDIQFERNKSNDDK